jgi:fructokinase
MTANTSSGIARGTYRERTQLASFGELLWDIYPDGARLGGAPANLAYHAEKLGAEATLITRVGNDELGARAVQFLSTQGVTVVSGRPSRYPTGRVNVEIVDGEPHYSIAEPAAYDEIELTPAARSAFEQADTFCFGSLALRARATRTTLCELLSIPCHEKRPNIAVDLNLRAPFDLHENVVFCLRHASILKLNQAELSALKHILGAEDPISVLQDRFEIRRIVVTEGTAGATLYGPHVQIRQPAYPSHGGDSVGAGDAFFAAFLVNLAAAESPSSAMERAAFYAAQVAGLSGAMPPPEQLRTGISRARARAPHTAKR